MNFYDTVSEKLVIHAQRSTGEQRHWVRVDNLIASVKSLCADVVVRKIN